MPIYLDGIRPQTKKKEANSLPTKSMQPIINENVATQLPTNGRSTSPEIIL